jgi:5'-methylthioadenosine phosphorylase
VPEPASVGLITGTGLYELDGLEGRSVESVKTPYGPAEVVTGRLEGVRVLHVPRHGAGHARLANQIDSRAGIAAIARLGAGALVATTVCGAVDPALELGSIVLFDDLHFPSNRMPDGSLCTLFTTPEIPGRGHWIYDRPYSARLGDALEAGARRAGVAVRRGGVYGHVDGPRLNTVSEIAQLAAAGITCVSQTGGPESVLAGEARLPFALAGFVTDHANGVGDVPTPPETLARLFGESGVVVQRVLRAALPAIASDPGEPAGILLAL